jgi:hypothetical protein
MTFEQFTADHWSYFMSNALFGSSRIVGIAAAYADQVMIQLLQFPRSMMSSVQAALERVRTFFDQHPVDGMKATYQRYVQSR